MQGGGHAVNQGFVGSLGQRQADTLNFGTRFTMGEKSRLPRIQG